MSKGLTVDFHNARGAVLTEHREDIPYPLARYVCITATEEAMLHRALICAQTAPGPALIDARIDASGYRRMLEIVRGAPK